MNPNLVLYPLLSTEKNNALMTQLVGISVGVLFLSLLAQVAIPLPFTPVPVTGQTFGVLCLGLLYGRRLGLMTIVAYILLGSLGLPLFAKGGSGFLFFSPTGGYLVGYIFAVYLCGYFAEKGWTQSFSKMALLMILAEAVIYLFGLLQLSLFVKDSVLAAGLYPFIIGDLVKMALVVVALPVAWKLKKRYMK